MKKITMITLLLAVLTGCSSQKKNEPATAETEAARGKNFEVLAQNAHGGRKEESHVAVYDQPELEALYKELGLNNVPVVNFESKMVVALFMGQQNTGGYSINVNEVLVEEPAVVIKVKRTAPEGMATMVITSPYCIVVVPKADKVIVE